MSSSGNIHQLPPDVIAKIKSSTSIIHLNGVVIELVKNALDANAHTVLISVDFKRGSCIVEDDGDGIPRVEFEADGGLGKAHYTSKFQKAGAFGHRGLFLASLASLALLTVTSRHFQDVATNSVIFHHSRPVARLIPAPVHQNLRLGSHGTCVTVNDLFGNMPVRVKSRALALQKPDELEREWEQLRYLLASIMLANPRLFKINVTDVGRGKRYSVRSRKQYTDTDEINRERIASVLTQSGLAASPAMDEWHILSATVPDITVRAAISTVPSPSKKLQFISMGNTPVISRNGSNILFTEVNRLVSLSDFGNAGSSSQTIPFPRSSGPRRSETSMSSRSLTKSVNKWPMFYIRIETSSAHSLCDDADDIASDSERYLQRIIDVLGAMILEFLKQQNLRPRNSRRQARSCGPEEESRTTRQQTDGRSFTPRQEAMQVSAEEGFGSQVKLPSFHRSPTINSGQQFSSWSRVKSAKESAVQRLPAEEPSSARIPSDDLQSRQIQTLSSHPSIEADRQINSNHGILPHHCLANPAPAALGSRGSEIEKAGPMASEALPDQHVSWVDPHTGKSHLINTRTGQTLDPKSSSLGPRLRSGSLFAAPPDQKQTDCVPIKSSWLDNLLKTWDNPVFSRTEVPVSNLETGENHEPNTTDNLHNCLQGIGTLGDAQVAKFRGKLKRHILAEATIISQVDQKFILAKMDIADDDGDPHGRDNVLVLIDQHAADERCRVEQLFEDLFFLPDKSPQGRHVRTADVVPIFFYISSTEQALFRKYLEFFENWGIYYRMETSTSGCTIQVTKLPLLIAERCRLEPDLVLDLVRREIWKREEDGRGTLQSKASLGSFPGEEDMLSDQGAYHALSHSWVHMMSGCPQGIIDLLNSRACRTAIMFNDPLSIEECKTLVARLARCAFPFQCAHGRPSMIPILDLRAPAVRGYSPSDVNIIPHDCYEHNDSKFSEAFRLRYGG